LNGDPKGVLGRLVDVQVDRPAGEVERCLSVGGGKRVVGSRWSRGVRGGWSAEGLGRFGAINRV
jgi:hypothetical protein